MMSKIHMKKIMDDAMLLVMMIMVLGFWWAL